MTFARKVIRRDLRGIRGTGRKLQRSRQLRPARRPAFPGLVEGRRAAVAVRRVRGPRRTGCLSVLDRIGEMRSSAPLPELTCWRPRYSSRP